MRRVLKTCLSVIFLVGVVSAVTLFSATGYFVWTYDYSVVSQNPFLAGPNTLPSAEAIHAAADELANRIRDARIPGEVTIVLDRDSRILAEVLAVHNIDASRRDDVISECDKILHEDIADRPR